MNKNLVVLALSMGITTSGSAGAATSDERNSCGVDPSTFVCTNDRGDPAPFGSPNQHAELAEGEQYLLLGRVLRQGREYVLAIDLCAQPWLASDYRRQNPFYHLGRASGFSWSDFVGTRVKLAARAKPEIVRDLNSEAHVKIRLEPLATPEAQNAQF